QQRAAVLFQDIRLRQRRLRDGDGFRHAGNEGAQVAASGLERIDGFPQRGERCGELLLRGAEVFRELRDERRIFLFLQGTACDGRNQPFPLRGGEVGSRREGTERLFPGRLIVPPHDHERLRLRIDLRIVENQV